MTAPPAPQPRTQDRLQIVLAALLWSTSGWFTKLLTQPTALHLETPALDPLQIAAARVFFGGLVLVPLLRPRDVRFSWGILATALVFTAMNALFLTAMAQGKAANAILLQYTAPMWLYLAGVTFLKEPTNWRATVSLWAGLFGIGLIVAGGWQAGQVRALVLALGSGIGYAGVLIGLRLLRHDSPVWLTVVNHLVGAAGSGLLLLVLATEPLAWPTPRQWLVLALFGSLQMGLPYLLMARGLRTVSPQEAGTLSLLEPLLNPFWAWLLVPEQEAVGPLTLVGGAIILGSLAWRYWPRRPSATK
jgi:drug/metabolite transporter (DMT)-like permease